MVEIAILLGTVTAGVGSVWLAALLIFGMFTRYIQHLLSLAAGALLATAFTSLLPEAFESQVAAPHLFAVLLAGLIFFFLLDKAELWHHGHEHHTPSGADAAHSHAVQPGSWAVLVGDAVHCFGDGVLIAFAFIADMHLGVMASLAVLVHEIPHHMGDLAVLYGRTRSQRMALLKVSLAGAVTALGGLMGYWLVAQLKDGLPYFLVLAASSFVYVALADLIPQLQKHASARQTVSQVVWLLIGVLLVTAAGYVAHGYGG